MRRTRRVGDLCFVLVGLLLIALAAFPTLCLLGWQRYRRGKAKTSPHAAPLER